MQQQDAERVVDLVGDAGGELAHAGQLLALTRASLVVSERAVRLLAARRTAAQLLDGVRQAHLDLGQALLDGDGVVAAGVVAAGAAVELVLGP